MQDTRALHAPQDVRTPPGTRRCRHCGCAFTPYHNNPKQRYCGRAECQRKRKSLWRRKTYVPLSERPGEESDDERERCRNAMRRLRLKRREKDSKASMAQAAAEASRARSSVMFRGLASILAGSREPQVVEKVLEEAERRGLSLSRAPSAGSP